MEKRTLFALDSFSFGNKKNYENIFLKMREEENFDKKKFITPHIAIIFTILFSKKIYKILFLFSLLLFGN
jgi:hypothetical protein